MFTPVHVPVKVPVGFASSVMVVELEYATRRHCVLIEPVVQLPPEKYTMFPVIALENDAVAEVTVVEAAVITASPVERFAEELPQFEQAEAFLLSFCE